jgi:hypothetical protein
MNDLRHAHSKYLLDHFLENDFTPGEDGLTPDDNVNVWHTLDLLYVLNSSAHPIPNYDTAVLNTRNSNAIVYRNKPSKWTRIFMDMLRCNTIPEINIISLAFNGLNFNALEPHEEALWGIRVVQHYQKDGYDAYASFNHWKLRNRKVAIMVCPDDTLNIDMEIGGVLSRLLYIVQPEYLQGHIRLYGYSVTSYTHGNQTYELIS